MVNGSNISGPAANWERGYTPNTNWAAPSTPVASSVDEPQWAAAGTGNGYQAVETYDPSFGFHPHQGGFHAPAPVGDAFSNGGANGFRPRPSPQPQQIQIGGFSPHMSSPHPSPGSGQMNGRCGSVPPHFNGTDSASSVGHSGSNGYMNGSPFASPSPRPPSSNPPPDSNGSSFRNGSESNAQTAHPNGPPGYPSQSPVPHQSSSHNSNGYPGQQQQQQQSTKGEQQQQQQQSMSWDTSGNDSKQQRSTPHEELNNRLKEKILNKQQQQMQQQQQQQHSFQDQSGNGQYYMNYGTPYSNGGGGSDDYGSVGSDPFQPTSASSPSASTPTGGNSVRLDVHVENSPANGLSSSSASVSTAHFLGQAHPQNSGTGGGDQQLRQQPDSSQQSVQPQQQQQQQQEPSQAMPHSIQQDHQQQQQQAPNSSHCPNHSTDNSSTNSSISSSAAQQQPANEQDRMDKLKNNVKDEVPPCQCFPSDQYPEKEENGSGPFYTQLGVGDSVAALRQLMEARTGLTGQAIRFEIITHTGKEGKTEQGCPIAKWIIRRSSLEEKVLCLIKKRKGHRCSSAWLIVISVAWEGLALRDADYLYSELVYRLNTHGVITNRRCGTNEDKTCACQGLDPETSGASFSFGCSWSMFFNGCKYARSTAPRKFRLTDESQEADIEDRLQRFATAIGPLFKRIAPDAYANQVEFEEKARDCRIGLQSGRPFAGVTACFDFCAHSHKDLHDMNNGCTVVTTLTRHRGFHKPSDDEQLHVLPHYILADVDEYGSVDGQHNKVASGAVEVLNKYPCILRRHSEPMKNKNKRTKQVATSATNYIPQQPVLISPSHEDSALLLQSSQISTTYCERPKPITNVLAQQSSSIESKIRALQNNQRMASQQQWPSIVPAKPAFNNWIGYNQQQPQYSSNYYSNGYSWNYQPSYTSTSPPPLQQNSQLAQWWSRGVRSPPSEMQAFGPVNPILPFQNLLQKQQLLPANSRPSVTVQVTDNEDQFRDPTIGGVAIALTHGSVLFECAKHELHATTALRQPNRKNPTRISLVLYQHRNMNESKHGYHVYERKMEKKRIDQQLEEEAKKRAAMIPPPPVVIPPLPLPHLPPASLSFAQPQPWSLIYQQQQPSQAAVPYTNSWASNAYYPSQYESYQQQQQQIQQQTLPSINQAFPYHLASNNATTTNSPHYIVPSNGIYHLPTV